MNKVEVENFNVKKFVCVNPGQQAKVVGGQGPQCGSYIQEQRMLQALE